MTEEALLGGRVRIIQAPGGLKAGLDAVALAASIPARAGQVVLDAGCGAGAVFLCLLARVPGVSVVAVERDPELAALAVENAARNGWADRVWVVCGDIADAGVIAGLGRLHHAAANPPYWPAGTPPPKAIRAGATHADAVPLAAWAVAVLAPLRHGGTASLVLPAARWAEAAGALRDAGGGGVAMRPLWPRAGVTAKRVILATRRGGRGPDAVLPGLVLHGDAGWTPAAEAMLRDAAPLA
ncbi:tRNA1(Val) (adenine(37)-N6)-methyltransferase [Humitalea sp. 24SJ18S-53]|uniref:tRNA1(Val) (adenine(37)-N6)-methyltransferase n=1 Tax=Humitalea sp. 24SJ18S-53 TaxID=3422307 RepID=UPI003D6794B9